MLCGPSFYRGSPFEVVVSQDSELTSVSFILFFLGLRFERASRTFGFRSFGGIFLLISFVAFFL